jgi:hypothetical protein
MLLKCTQIITELHIILILILEELLVVTIFTRKTYTLRRFLTPTACVTLPRKSAEEIRITIFMKSSRVKKMIVFAAIIGKLTNNFAKLVSSRFGPDVVRGPPV